MISHNVYYKVKIALEISQGTTLNMHLKLTFYKDTFLFEILHYHEIQNYGRLHSKGLMKNSCQIWGLVVIIFLNKFLYEIHNFYCHLKVIYFSPRKYLKKYFFNKIFIRILILFYALC